MAVEFPDQEIVNFLKQYGQLKSENLRRLCYSEEGFRNIERGIRVAEFTSLDRDLPRKVVTQGLEIFFKYTGQPITYYRCGSTDHIVRHCEKRHARPTVNQRLTASGGGGHPWPPNTLDRNRREHNRRNGP